MHEAVPEYFRDGGYFSDPALRVVHRDFLDRVPNWQGFDPVLPPMGASRARRSCLTSQTPVLGTKASYP
jgi:hypothetical protein